MKVSITVEDNVIPQIIDKVFEKYNYNKIFLEPDKIKKEILEKIVERKYDNLIWRDKYLKFSLTSYFTTLVKSYCAQYSRSERKS